MMPRPASATQARLSPGHGHELLVVVAPDEQEHRRAGIDALERLGYLADAGDRLPIDLEDDVALREAGVEGRAVPVDVHDQCAAAIARELRLTRNVRSDWADVHPEAGCRPLLVLWCGSAGALGAGFHFEIELVDRHVERLLLPVAHDRDRH